MKATVKWIDGLSFIGRTETHHSVPMDTTIESGGMNSGAMPMELLLLALGGCMGMELVSILEKKRAKLDDFWVELEAERTDLYPRTFSTVRMRYVFVGKEIDRERVRKAVEISAEKYCSVGAMLRGSVTIEHDIKILERGA
ncbi:MAG: OsmC family protein [Candidatus Thermoplasmatota archaeon]